MGPNGKNKFIVFEGISKQYKDILALDNVSFEISEGEIFGYIGPNGAGKTTTIKIIVGLITEFQGNCCISGFSMPDNLPSVQSTLGYLPQEVAFQEWRTVDHALKTFGKLSGLGNNELEHHIHEVLDLLDLSEVRHKKIIELSGGMVQKVGLAQALLHNPKILVLDEPLSGLDPASRYMMKTTIKDLSKKGRTVFFSSHILSDVQDVATRIGIINKGHIIKIGTLDELKSHFSLTNDLEVLLSQNSGQWGKLNSLPGINSIEQTDPDRLLVHLDRKVDMDDISHNIIKCLIDLDCRIRSFKPITPDLDELYLKYIEGDKNL